MPAIIDYAVVLQQMRDDGFVSLYHNSGAFGFPPGVETHIAGWITAEDPTIRPWIRAHATLMTDPVPPLLLAWRDILTGQLWLMPKSHWAYELDFGNRDWLIPALAGIGVDSTQLHAPNASAIAFEPAEAPAFERFANTLLTNLKGSDFALAFPARPVLCTVHHHRQIWWQTRDPRVHERLRTIAQSTQSSSGSAMTG